MIPISSFSASGASANECSGNCAGCGKIHIKLLSYADESGRQLLHQVQEALKAHPAPHKIIEVSEPGAVAATGATALPALLLEGEIMVQGRVPSAEEIVELLRDLPLRKSKLYRLRRIAVAVDVNRCSDSALRFGWEIAQKTGASLEVVHVMDSIFVNHPASDSGFLSGYQQTIQQELDGFIHKTLPDSGVSNQPAIPGAPGQPADPGVRVSSKVLYGFPESALDEFSRELDLLILGMTGRETAAGKLFGSVSVEVSQRAHCPVLLVPAEASFEGLKNVLYASHFDSLSALHIRQALSFSKHFDGQVHFVHVSRPDEPGEKMDGGLLEKVYRESNVGQPFLFRKMVSDNVLQALYEYAFYHRIELLVFVTPERNFWETMLHRSISRAAAWSTALPILVVHTKDDQAS